MSNSGLRIDYVDSLQTMSISLGYIELQFCWALLHVVQGIVYNNLQLINYKKWNHTNRKLV